MSIEDQIRPFMLVQHENSTSLILNVGDYRADVFAEREDEGFEGNGYDWGSLAAVFLEEKCPALKKDIQFDPEGSMFCAYSKNRQSLEKFVIEFHAMCENADQMRDLFSRAELD